MAKHILLVRFTDQGLRAIKDSPQRASAFAESVERMGARVDGVYWTSGAYDGVLILDTPDDETASAVTLTLAQAGNVQTQSLRAYDRDEMQSILGKLD